MKKHSLLLLLLLCAGRATCQRGPVEHVYIDFLQWKINIPASYTPQSKESWRALQGKGQKSIENATNKKIPNKTEIVFFYKVGGNNFFEAVVEPYTQTGNESYEAKCERMNNLLYHAFEQQKPGIAFDTIKRVEMIDGLAFQALTVKERHLEPDTRIITIYRRLFGNTELTVSVMYQHKDEENARQITQLFKKSKFGRRS